MLRSGVTSWSLVTRLESHVFKHLDSKQTSVAHTNICCDAAFELAILYLQKRSFRYPDNELNIFLSVCKIRPPF